MPAKSISLEMTPASHKRLSQAMGRSKVPAQDISELSTMHINSILRLLDNAQDNQGMSIWAFVGIADAIKIDPGRLLEEISGDNAPLSAMRISQARATVSRRQIRQAAQKQAINVQQTLEPITATIGEAEPVQPTPVNVPSTIDLMARIRALGEEERMMVDEFLNELP